MAQKPLRVRVHAGQLVLLEPFPLKEGAEFEVFPPDEATTASMVGVPAAILAAMRRPPHVDHASIDALKRAIKDGKLPMRSEGIFDRKKE